jgi:DNA-binding GntR family transcriptional regulator
MRLDRIFHEKIYKMSNNEILINLLGNLNDIIRFFGIKVLQEKNRSLTTIIEHKNVLKAIIDKDIHSAKKYMEEHMNQTSNKIINT